MLARSHIRTPLTVIRLITAFHRGTSPLIKSRPRFQALPTVV